MPTFEGNDLDNELTGGDEGDTIKGFGGKDRLIGNGGNDTIEGGTGEDLLAGGAGSDSLDGGDGRDILFGGEANLDVLTEPLFSESAPPAFSLTPDSDPDTLDGGAGNDVFFAGYGDTVVGDTSEGGDTVHLSYLGAPHGIDYVWRSPVPNVGITNATVGWVQGSNFADSFYGISHVIAMGGNDRISVSNLGSGLVDGGDGNDTIEVYPLTHEYLHVPFFGTILGGAGNDIIHGRSTNTDGGEGDDIIFGDGRGGAGNDAIDSHDLHGDLTLTGDAGGDFLTAGDGDDILSAGGQITFDNDAEVDELYGGAGNDVIFSGFGDIVDGGDGYDTVGLSYVGASAGITGDTAILHQGQPLVPGGGTFQSIERFSDIAMTEFDDKMVIGDQDDPATVRAWNGNDHLIGQEVSITMYGGNGHDLLVGSTSFDILYGESGDDRLIGYLGADQLWGGEGADRFMFTSTADSGSDYSAHDDLDSILDWEAIDRIDLSGIDADPLTSGDQAFTSVVTAFGFPAGPQEAGTVVIGGFGGTLFVSVFVDAGAEPDMVIDLWSLAGESALTSASLIL